MHEHQEEWWRQQQEEDAHRRLDGTSVLHEDICIQREKLPVLQKEDTKFWNMNKLNVCRKKMTVLENMTQMSCYV